MRRRRQQNESLNISYLLRQRWREGLLCRMLWGFSEETEISERMIRKTISFLAGVGAIEKRTLTFDKLIDHEDNITETKALRSVYQISIDKVRLNTIEMDMEDYRKRISKLPIDIQKELINEKRHELLEIAQLKTIEGLIIDKTVNVSNVNSRDPRVKTVLSYAHHKDLGEIVDYLHRLRK